jgi:hypothetical protein
MVCGIIRVGSTSSAQNLTFASVKNLFVTVSLYKIQFSFINFIIEQFSLRVIRVDDFIWLTCNFSFTKMKFWLELSFIPLEHR